MKKSVIILIGVIYLASIIFIGFFGIKMRTYDETIYAERVECINEDLLPINNADGTLNYKYIVLSYTEGITYRLEYKVYPENATQKEAEFLYDSSTGVAQISNGYVIFNRAGMVTVQIRSKDGTNRIAIVKIIAKA